MEKGVEKSLEPDRELRLHFAAASFLRFLYPSLALSLANALVFNNTAKILYKLNKLDHTIFAIHPAFRIFIGITKILSGIFMGCTHTFYAISTYRRLSNLYYSVCLHEISETSLSNWRSKEYSNIISDYFFLEKFKLSRENTAYLLCLYTKRRQHIRPDLSFDSRFCIRIIEHLAGEDFRFHLKNAFKETIRYSQKKPSSLCFNLSGIASHLEALTSSQKLYLAKHHSEFKEKINALDEITLERSEVSSLEDQVALSGFLQTLSQELIHQREILKEIYLTNNPEPKEQIAIQLTHYQNNVLASTYRQEIIEPLLHKLKLASDQTWVYRCYNFSNILGFLEILSSFGLTYLFSNHFLLFFQECFHFHFSPFGFQCTLIILCLLSTLSVSTFLLPKVQTALMDLGEQLDAGERFEKNSSGSESQETLSIPSLFFTLLSSAAVTFTLAPVVYLLDCYSGITFSSPLSVFFLLSIGLGSIYYLHPLVKKLLLNFYHNHSENLFNSSVKCFITISIITSVTIATQPLVYYAFKHLSFLPPEWQVFLGWFAVILSGILAYPLLYATINKQLTKISNGFDLLFDQSDENKKEKKLFLHDASATIFSLAFTALLAFTASQLFHQQAISIQILIWLSLAIIGALSLYFTYRGIVLPEKHIPTLEVPLKGSCSPSAILPNDPETNSIERIQRTGILFGHVLSFGSAILAIAGAVIGMQYLGWSTEVVIILGLMSWVGKLIFYSDNNKVWGDIAVSFFYHASLNVLKANPRGLTKQQASLADNWQLETPLLEM